ncbi:MAG: T9SS type A sorting domain-containing protein [Bacteroidota bacterium]
MKITCLRFLLAVLLVSMMSTTGIGQSIYHLENEDPEGPLPSEGCLYEMRFNVRLANLELLTTPNSQGLYPLPASYPAMYLRYSLFDNCWTGVDQVSLFRFDRDFTNAVNNGINYYEGTVYIPSANFADACLSADAQGNITLPFTIDLQTQSGSAYPMCLYTDTDNIFACDAFSITAPYCGNQITLPGSGGGNNCVSANLATFAGTIQIACRSCAGDEPGDGFPDSCSGSGSRNAAATLSAPLENIAVSPNPFHDQLRVSWPSDVAVQEVHLFDASGKRLESHVAITQMRDGTLYLSTGQFSSGLYFLQIKSIDGTKVVKLVKP